jgi:two-component system, OmpR family, phosphate regulon response regulator PhoB
LAKILIVDDEASIVSLLKTLLELEGYEVATALSGLNMAQIVEDEKPDLVLIDFYLGKEKGLRALQCIRCSPDIADTPVLLTSALDHSDEAEKAGADGFILKPFNARDLLTAIEQILARRSEHRPDRLPES